MTRRYKACSRPVISPVGSWPINPEEDFLAAMILRSVVVPASGAFFLAKPRQCAYDCLFISSQIEGE